MMTLSPEPPVSEMMTLLRELNHRINNQFASAINLIAVEAVRAQGAEAKALLSNVVDLLHGCSEVDRALLMPERETLIDAAVYFRKLCCALRGALLDRLNIQLTFKSAPLPLQPERCWRLGLILHELVTNATKHACFDGRSGEIKIKLARADWLVNCVVSDNGSAATRAGHGQGQGSRIIGALARSLGGRIEHGIGADFRSVVCSLPLSERERQANRAIDSRAVRPPFQAKTKVCGAPEERRNSQHQGSRPGAVASAQDPRVPPAPERQSASLSSTDVLGGLLSPSHRMDVL